MSKLSANDNDNELAFLAQLVQEDEGWRVMNDVAAAPGSGFHRFVVDNRELIGMPTAVETDCGLLTVLPTPTTRP